jgi:hypothetical protein
MSDIETPQQSGQSDVDWNIERFGPERPACRHYFRAVVAERDRYREALERITSEAAACDSAVARALGLVAFTALERG